MQSEDFGRVKAALSAKFGEPVEAEPWVAKWRTRDTLVSARDHRGIVVINYDSILMAGRPMQETERLRSEEDQRRRLEDQRKRDSEEL